jgi:hypothetical protein
MKFAIFFSCVLGALATPTIVLEKKQAAPRAFNITSLKLNGSGCPPGSAVYTLSGKSVSIFSASDLTSSI